MKNYQNVDHYIADQENEETRERLQSIRTLIKETAKDAEEVISYGMPAYKWKGILVYFAAFKNHISFFPAGSGIDEFKEELSEFKTSKGTIQVQHKQEIPYTLFKEIIQFRMSENERRAELKKLSKK